MSMTVTKFLISPEFGCCTSGELIAFSRADRAGYIMLKEWAIQEMKNRGIDIIEQ